MQWLEQEQRHFIENLYSSKSVTPGLRIYRRSFIGIHGSALEKTYPLTFQLLGTKKFRYFCQKLLREYPIKSGDLNDYGAEFSSILNQAEKEIPPQASNLAAFEWACFICKIAPKVMPYLLIDKDSTHSTDIQTVPSVNILRLDHPIDQIFKTKNTCTQTDIYYLVVYRYKHNVHYQEISQPEYEFIKPLLKTTPLLKALKRALIFDQTFNPLNILSLLFKYRLLMKGQQ